MFGNVVKNIDIEEFDNIIKKAKIDKNNKNKQKQNIEKLKKVIDDYKKIYKKNTKEDFPQDPKQQLYTAIDAVFNSWMNDRATLYREHNNIKNINGTAVNIQSMVFGNYGDNSGTGVCFSRNPTTGEKEIYGEYLMNAQGEDVVAGIRTPIKISELKKNNREIYKQLEDTITKLEKHYKDIQDIEFTIFDGKLYLLQTRNGKRSGIASVKIAVDMVKEKMITKEEAIMRITEEQFNQLFFSTINEEEKNNAERITIGLNASLGAGCGEVVFNSKDAEKMVKSGKKVILVRQNTSPEDISGMIIAEGILTSTGGMTSHAAIVSRGLGTPCVICAGQINFIDDDNVEINKCKFKKGDKITIDGTTGEVFRGELKLEKAKFNYDVKLLLSWCDEICKKSKRKISNNTINGFEVHTNADQPLDAKQAIDFGARGIGLCRTEHMFFDKEKLTPFRAMILSDTKELRKKYLKQIMPFQQDDFTKIFKIMNGKSVIIRLLDPPLHEFLPKTDEEIEKMAKFLRCSNNEIIKKKNTIKETNPMMGHRGCRLALTYPEIYEMQIEAICNALIKCSKNDIKLKVKVMIPIICDDKELKFVKNICKNKISEVKNKQDKKTQTLLNQIEFGTMIETPRSSLLADKIAENATFFSFGTNDLTQTTFAFSRDDINKVMNSYLENGVFDENPFKTLDKRGVGQLLKIAVDSGRETNKNLNIGICGEHGGDPKTIEFCYKIGLNYVSCSPFRVPLARLISAQAVLRNK